MKTNICKTFYFALAITFFVPYFGAYVISHIFKLQGREDMPTIKEWFDINAYF